jgi:N-acyl-D-amino-acid deacylase
LAAAASSERYDVLIKNTKIVDGTGKRAFIGNVAIKGEKIVAVGTTCDEGEMVIDGSGLITCPGFIDPHSHAERTIQKFPLAENLIMQGITTFLGGNCGTSPGPTADLTFGEWLENVEQKGISINMASLVGHGTIRRLVMGTDIKRTATSAEIEEMKAYIDEAMRSGAFGFSGGIDAPWPGYFASMEEKVELAKIVGKYNGFYDPHTRHERNHWVTDDINEYSYVLYTGPPEDIWVGRYRGLMEAIDVCRKADIPLHIAHIPNAYMLPLPHPDYLEKAAARATMEILDNANADGVTVTCDVIFPPVAQSFQKTPIINEFLTRRFNYPDWLAKLEKEEFIEKLKTKEFRAKIRKLYDTCRLKFSMVHTKVDPYWMEGFKVIKCKNSKYVGKTIAEIAVMKKDDPLEAVFDILVEDPEIIWVGFLDRRYNQAAVSTIIQHPLCEPSTDIMAFPAKIPSALKDRMGPAQWSIYPYYIDTYVKKLKVLSLEEAIKKATYLPAQRLRLNRGELKPGAYADVLVFNYDTIRMTGDFLNPDIAPDGIEYVYVNGTLVYKDKTHTGKKPGKVLRNKL